MALKKEIQTKYNVKIEYWKIVQVSVNFYTSVAKVELAGFVNEKARRDGALPVEITNFALQKDNFVFTEDRMQEKNVLQLSYSIIKSLPDWVSSIDLI